MQTEDYMRPNNTVKNRQFKNNNNGSLLPFVLAMSQQHVPKIEEKSIPFRSTISENSLSTKTLGRLGPNSKSPTVLLNSLARFSIAFTICHVCRRRNATKQVKVAYLSFVLSGKILKSTIPQIKNSSMTEINKRIQMHRKATKQVKTSSARFCVLVQIFRTARFQLVTASGKAHKWKHDIVIRWTRTPSNGGWRFAELQSKSASSPILTATQQLNVQLHSQNKQPDPYSGKMKDSAKQSKK